MSTPRDWSPFEVGLHHHMVYNHFPPVGCFIAAAREAIYNCFDGDPNAAVYVQPTDQWLPSYGIVETFHLWPFVNELLHDEEVWNEEED